MTYTKQQWVDGTSIANAERLNHIEDGIYNNSLDNTYSTNEIDTGKTWIDGKKIYRKVISGVTGSTADTWSDVGDIGNNINTITCMYGIISNYLSVPVYFSSDYYVGLQWVGTKIQVINKGYLETAIKVIVEYTKTTD